MRLKGANCKNCYKCVRACPVKAISIFAEKATTMKTLYLLRKVLPRRSAGRPGISSVRWTAKLDDFSGEKVYFSISSTFSEYFMNSIPPLGAALKKWGGQS